jgi:hypothetical protein
VVSRRERAARDRPPVELRPVEFDRGLDRYPLQLCFTPRRSPRYPTLAHLLEPASSIGLADSFARYAAMSRATGRSLRIDELNSVSCGADPAVSNTFGSALWVLNTLFEMVRVGIHGVNVHTFPGAGYELFRISRARARWQAVVAPEYYGLLMFARAAPPGSRPLAVANAASGAVRTWATQARDGTIRVLLVNSGTRPRNLSVAVSGSRSRAFTGQFAGPPRESAIVAVRGRFVVALPRASAALLLSPPS